MCFLPTVRCKILCNCNHYLFHKGVRARSSPFFINSAEIKILLTYSCVDYRLGALILPERLVNKGCSPAARPEMLRKIKLNIWITVFFRRYVYILKEYELHHFKFKYSRRTPSAAESERAVPSPDLALWVIASRPSGGKTAAAMSRAGLQALQPRDGLEEDFMYLFIFSNVSNAGILITIFT